MSDLNSTRRDYKAALEEAVQTQEDLASEIAKIATMLDSAGKGPVADAFAAVARNLGVQGIKSRAQAAALSSKEPQPNH